LEGRMKGKNKKGEFFLLAAFAFIIAFYIGISSYISPGFSGIESSGIIYLQKNIEDEYPKVLNLGLNESKPITNLVNFTLFVQNVTKSRGMDLSVFWLVSRNVGDDLNVTLGNFLGDPINVAVNISGDIKALNISDKSIRSFLFSSPPSEFNLTINFNTTERNLLLEKYKVSMYFFLELEEGDNVFRSERRV
jgi:hypothetical protein